MCYFTQHKKVTNEITDDSSADGGDAVVPADRSRFAVWSRKGGRSHRHSHQEEQKQQRVSDTANTFLATEGNNRGEGSVNNVTTAVNPPPIAMMMNSDNNNSIYNMDPQDIRAAFLELRHANRTQLERAHTVADIISKRDFGTETNIVHRNNHSGIFPSGFGYGLLLGTATFVAISAPGMMLARAGLARYVGGGRIAHHAVKTVAFMAGGVVGSKYVQRYQTLEELKILGTHLSPMEPSSSADALCQHPLITQAIAEQRRWNIHGGEWNPTYSHRWQSSSSSWWLNDARILAEFQQVLANCEQRGAILEMKGKSGVEQSELVTQ